MNRLDREMAAALRGAAPAAMGFVRAAKSFFCAAEVPLRAAMPVSVSFYPRSGPGEYVASSRKHYRYATAQGTLVSITHLVDARAEFGGSLMDRLVGLLPFARRAAPPVYSVIRTEQISLPGLCTFSVGGYAVSAKGLGLRIKENSDDE
jgi:hypothetical protein